MSGSESLIRAIRGQKKLMSVANQTNPLNPLNPMTKNHLMSVANQIKII